jgi:hypothetical protein
MAKLAQAYVHLRLFEVTQLRLSLLKLLSASIAAKFLLMSSLKVAP